MVERQREGGKNWKIYYVDFFVGGSDVILASSSTLYNFD